MKEWVCSCGQQNTGNFCSNCGKPKRVLGIKKIKFESNSSKNNLAILDGIKKAEQSIETVKSDKSKPNFSKDSLTKRHETSNVDTQSKSGKNTAKSTPKVEVYSPPPAPPDVFIQKNRQQFYFEEESLFASFTKDPQEFLIQRKDILIKAFLFLLLFIVTSVDFGSLGKISHSTAPSATYMNKTNTQSTPSQNDSAEKSHKIPSRLDMHDAASDLSLGAICLGDNLDRVHALLGKEETITNNNDGYFRYYYPDIEVVVQNNTVEALVSRTAKVETKRGVHQNSAKQEVIKTYGRDYELFELNGNTVLEYPFISSHGKKSLLRFALKKEVVEYISVRTVSDEQQEKNSVKQEDIFMQVFRQYWDKLNNRDFAGAYNLMTDKQQNQIGEFENYRNGYNEMVENKLTDVKILEKNDNFARVSYTLQAKDRINGQIKVQIFQGNADLLKSSDNWKIDNLEAKLIRAFNE